MLGVLGVERTLGEPGGLRPIGLIGAKEHGHGRGQRPKEQCIGPNAVHQQSDGLTESFRQRFFERLVGRQPERIQAWKGLGLGWSPKSDRHRISTCFDGFMSKS